ncbi:MAG: ABC transporter transmembrane domain-containing protein, partial [Nakamurella sp.]
MSGPGLLRAPAVSQSTAGGVDDEVTDAPGGPATAAAEDRKPTPGKQRIPLRKLWPYLRPHRRVLLVVSAISVVGAALSVAQPAMVALVISSVQQAKPLAGVVALLVVLVLATAVINGIQQFLLQRTAEAVVRDTRQLLVQRLLRLPISDFDTRRTGDLVSRVGSDTTLLRAVVTSGLVDAVSGVLVFVGSVIAMALISPSLLGLTLVVVAIAIAAVVGLGGRIQKLTLTAQTQVGQLAAAVARAIPGIRTIRAAGATDRETVALNELTAQAYRTGVGLAKVMALIAPIIGIALQGAFIAVLAVGGYLVANGSMQVAQLVAFILYLFMMIMPLGRVFQAYTATQNALGAVVRIQEITDLAEQGAADPIHRDGSLTAGPVSAAAAPKGGPVPAAGPGAARPLPSADPLGRPFPPVGPLSGRPLPGRRPTGGVAVSFDAVSFDAVSFGYGEHMVLSELSFAVPVGTKTAIVGPSGA